MGWSWLVALALVVPACATKPPPAPAAAQPAAPLPPLPRSSIAAVVAHKTELALTDDQIRQMETIDLERERNDDKLRENGGMPAKPKPVNPTPSGPPGGGAMGMRRGGGMRGGGHRGAMPGSRDAPPTLDDRLDESDTQAYLDAEKVLTDAQRDRARDIAEDYREQRYDRRQQAAERAKQQHP
jgi:hypothetical protein